MEGPLHLNGSIAETTLYLTWGSPSEYSEFSVRIDKCDPKSDCKSVHDETYRTKNLSVTDEIFSQCSVYNIHVEAIALNGQKQTLRDEINITNQTPVCFLSEETVLVVGCTILGILLLCIVGIFFFFWKKGSLYDLSRFVSEQ